MGLVRWGTDCRFPKKQDRDFRDSPFFWREKTFTEYEKCVIIRKTNDNGKDSLPMCVLEKEKDPGKNIQLLLLLTAGSAAFLLILLDKFFPGTGYFLAEKLLPVPCLLFAGSALTRRISLPAKGCLLLSGITVFWFAAVQLQHHLSQMGMSAFGIFAAGCLLAFPFAAVTGEGDTGLKWLGSVYVAASMLMVLFAGMLLTDTVPETLAQSIYWDGTRLAALWHPNVCACVLMIGIGITLFFILQAKKRWEKVLLALMTALQFAAIALTNSRTSILLTCALFGGTLFFGIWKGGWKRFLAGAAAALAALVVLFALSGFLFDLNTEAQISRLLEQRELGNAVGSDSQTLLVNEQTGEAIILGNSNQGELMQDMKTLNGRTHIWKAAVTALQDNPPLKIWGTEYVSIEISSRNYFPVAHAHNSWMQVMMKQGIPGLLLSLVYTVLALWNILVLLWRPNVALEKKVIAMLVLCILAASFLEIYLFGSDLNTFFAHYLFFFMLGCLGCWRRAASSKI